VRAVFELYGPKVDSKTNVPLFNKTAWGRANNVLKEVLDGNASDPPGFSFYTFQLNAKGEFAIDALGIELITCNRGTNDTECVHKQIVTTFGTWCTGVEMSDRLMAEHRHRYNQRVSERRRLGFPKLGHFDTWRIDSLQLLVEHNHGVLLHPEWSNATDYISTPEGFGTVAIHSPELNTAIASIELPPPLLDTTKASRPLRQLTPVKRYQRELTSDQRYLCKTMGTDLPLLPIHGEAECKLFERLVLTLPSLDFDAMAIKWCEHVDG
jgi:hypothetical protein